MARDEMKSYVMSHFMTVKRRVCWSSYTVYPVLLNKISKYITHRYFSLPLTPDIKSYIDIFPVEKGADTRTVFNGRSSGTNSLEWAQHFRS